MLTILQKIGSFSINIDDSLARSKAVDMDFGFASPCGLSKKVDLKPSLQAFLFISSKKINTSGKLMNCECLAT